MFNSNCKLLEDKQEKIEALQVEIKSLNVEIITREESGINQMVEKVKSNKNVKYYDMPLQAIIAIQNLCKNIIIINIGSKMIDTKLKNTMSLEFSQLKSTQN